MQPSISRANTPTLSSAGPGQCPPPPVPGACGLHAPAAPASLLVPAPELRAWSSGFPGSQAARPPEKGGGSGGGRTAGRTPGSSPLASPAQRAALCASWSRVCGGGQSRCAGGHRVRGWGRARAGGSQSHPSESHHRRGAALTCARRRGTRQLGTRWPKEEWGL